MNRAIFIILISGFILISGCRNKKNTEENGPDQNTTGRIILNRAVDEFYFVGMIGKNPGIYKFISKNLDSGKRDKNIIKLWSKKNEKVIKLSYSPDKKSLFFLTAEDFGKKAIFPFVNDIRLYRINQDSSKVIFIKKIGSGLQVFTLWGQDKSFRIILNSFDRNSADFVNQQISFFNSNGVSTANNSKKFNISKVGYPQLEESMGITSSPGSKYSVFAVDSQKTIIYLQSNSDGKVEQVTLTSQKLNQADWSIDEKYLIFSTVNPSAKNRTTNEDFSRSSKIYVYSISKKMLKTSDVTGIKNFFVMGDLIMFDKGYQQNSYIGIINYKTLKPIFSIHLQGGCGLKSNL